MTRAVSFFSGVGGFDATLLAAGHEVVGACEVDEHCRRVYAARFGEPPWFPRDICEVRPEEIPDADLWCGGFPCQDASVAGKRAGAAEGTRTGLWWTWQRLMAARRPAMVLAENVPGLLSVRQGRDFGAVIASLLTIGYRVSWTILDARYFGVAQRRRRVFICASLDGDPRAALFDGPESAPGSRGGPVAMLIDGRWQSMQTMLFGGSEPPFAGAWPGSGYAAGDRCWVRDVPEWREPVERASLAATLEAGPIPARYYLSARACAGILRRAERRGRALPAALDAALRATVDGGEVAPMSPVALDWQSGSDGDTDSSFRGKSRKWITRAGDYTGALGATKRDAVIGAAGALPAALDPRETDGSAGQLVFGGNRTSGPREEASALSAHGGASGRLDFETETFVVGPIQAQGTGGRGHRVDAEAAATGHLIATAPTLRAADGHHGRSSPRGDGCDALVVSRDAVPKIAGRLVTDLRAGNPHPSAVLVAGQQHGSDVGAMGALQAGHGDVQSGVPFVATGTGAGWWKDAAEDGIRLRAQPGGTPENVVLAVEAEAFTLDADPRGRGVLAFGSKDDGRDVSHDESPTLRAAGHDWSHANAGAPPAVVALRGRADGSQAEARADGTANSLRTPGGGSSHQFVAHGAIRRLTPTETERLQGFPDGFTCTCGVVSYSTAACRCPDGSRYRMMGNAVAVPVVEWIAVRVKNLLTGRPRAC